MVEKWEVRFSNRASKNYKLLQRNGRKPSIANIIDLLALELEMSGPTRSNWPHYGKLGESRHHCHLKTGRPTFVACWKVSGKQIEVYYVGTHEGAPY